MPNFSQLVVDVGNSCIKVGLFDSNELQKDQLPVCQHAWTVDKDKNVDWQTIELHYDAQSAKRPLIAGSNPAGINRVISSWPSHWNQQLREVERKDDIDVAINVDFPSKVGIDRLLNVQAVNRIRVPNQPAIVIDVGTATTVDYVSTDGTFQGGAILPGFDLCSYALHHYTAKLPLIPYHDLATNSSPSALGKNTEQAIKSGLVWGQLGAIKELIQQLTETLNENSHQLYLTGGGSNILNQHLANCSWEPHLALQALALIASKT